jgi:hypothetical protein
MPDHIRYDLLTQQALRSVVRQVLSDAAKKGLPGDHHFYISFDTQAAGVRMSDRLRAQYPEEMTVILQHQFWDLEVGDSGFEVGMSFGGIPEKLVIPFDAISGFFDPSVQFGLQFEEIAEGQPGLKQDTQKPDGKKTALSTVSTPERTGNKSETKTRLPMVPPAPASVPAVTPVGSSDTTEPGPDKPPGGGEVVRLDRFRKK